MKPIFLTLMSFSICLALDCINCGVFLTALSPECRGKPTNISCAPENVGCLTITGLNGDGSYYVEKRCATKSEDRLDGCREITIRGIQGRECLCHEDLCNSSNGLTFPVVYLSIIVFYMI